MTRLFIFLLSALLLIGCGRSEPDTTASEAAAAPAPGDTSHLNPAPGDTANVETLPKDTTSRWPE